jgi:alpha-L-arabinofuranosidase
LRAHAAIPDLKTYTWLVRSPITWVGKFLKGVRKSIAKTPQNGKMISIAFDEWNIWHMWFILPFKFEWRVNIVDGMFAAGILNMLCRETNNYGIGMAAYFQPINEGLVAVEPFSTRLTSIGQIFILHRIHSGNRLIKTSSPKGLDICASMNPQGHQIYVSLLNTNGTKSQATELQLQGIKSSAKLNMTILTADTLGAPNFTERKKQLILDSPNQIKLTISPRSIVYLEISFE